MNEMRFMLPENLEIDELIGKNKEIFNENGLKKEKLLFICDCLIDSRAKHRKELNDRKKRFVPLSSEILQEVIYDYEKHLGFLLDTGVVLSDHYFTPGKKCRAYCFNPIYDGQKLKQVLVESYKLKKAVKRSLENRTREAKKGAWGYGYITKWWDAGKLKIDWDSACKWLNAHERKQIQAIIQDSKKKKTRRIKRVIDTVQDFKHLAWAINNRKAYYKFSGEGHRFYNPITNLKRELRNFLTYEGKPLIEVDKKNSQPFLSTSLFKSSFWESGDEENKLLSIRRIDKEMYNRIKNLKVYRDIITLLKTSETRAGKASPFKKFIDLVVSGEFYEYIQKHFAPIYPTRFKTRQDVKVGLLTIFYLDNQKTPYNKPSQTFKEHFPEVYQLFKLIKTIEANFLPVLLQRIESFLILDIVCREISIHHPNIPLYTIHDSIITTKGNESIVELAMKKEIENWTGFCPSVERKDLTQMKFAA